MSALDFDFDTVRDIERFLAEHHEPDSLSVSLLADAAKQLRELVGWEVYPKNSDCPLVRCVCNRAGIRFVRVSYGTGALMSWTADVESGGDGKLYSWWYLNHHMGWELQECPAPEDRP